MKVATFAKFGLCGGHLAALVTTASFPAFYARHFQWRSAFVLTVPPDEVRRRWMSSSVRSGPGV